MASTVMDRPDEGRMHQLAVRSAAKAISGLEEHLSKQKNRIVAIERHDCDWRDGRKTTEEHFLWIKARDKTTVGETKASYRSHYGNKRLDVTFNVEQQIVDGSTLLADLDKHNDKFVVLTTQIPGDARLASPTTYGASSYSKMTQSLSKSPSNPNQEDFMMTGTSALESSPHSGFQHRGDLVNLGPTSPDQAIFVDQRDMDHMPDVAMGDSTDLSMDDFLTEGQKSQFAFAKQGSAADANLAGIKKEQHGGFGQLSTMPVAKTGVQPSTVEYVPRPIANPFEVAATLEDHAIATQSSLRQLLQETQLEILEAAARQGLNVLAELEKPLRTIPRDTDACKWLEQINEVRSQASRNRTIVGVVGNTGAGKSSVINAVLDEERLVPTNCMRACTAVVTELSYNDSNDEASQYRAEVEFIRPEDWRRELTILFDEVFDQSHGINKDVQNPDTIAGVAYAKIRAVYPKYTKDMLLRSTVKQLMDVPSVRSILGTTRLINSSDCASFYKQLQHYVDSQQKFELVSDGEKGAKTKRDLEFWPLIKVVHIYTKADALSTGAVIVDLPGVHDSNAARAAVAEGYLKECTGLWIVAPITRAVDDKAAKNLLGNSFKRQLKYDGIYSAVTFICSKTDDISRTEAAEALQLGSQLAELDDKRKTILEVKSTVKDNRTRIRAERDKLEPLTDQCDEQIEYWEGVITKIENGQSVPAASPTKKRKRSSEYGASEDEELDDQPMTAEQAYRKIEGQKQIRKATRHRGQLLRDEMQQLQQHLNGLDARELELDGAADALCIKGRNDWSRRHIREDFAEGIKELDQENAAEEDPDNFDPEDDIRDYEKVAGSLPVFCVSSRAYQKLCGRLQKDGNVAGFVSQDQTEIPQLQVHCRKLTESGRHARCKDFLNSISQLLNSLALWASDDGSGADISIQQRTFFKNFVTSNLQRLGQTLDTAVIQTMEDASDTLKEILFGQLTAAGYTAALSAVSTATGWGAPRDDGGLFWATYKATVRRHGIFQGASGSRNFNTELTDPLYKVLGTPWEKTFHRRLPGVFQGFPKTTSTTIQEFHTAIEETCKEQNVGISRIARLRDNCPIYENAFKNVANSMVININEAQREINREFTPSVAAAMGQAYDFCSVENGRGSYARMKEHMFEHVSNNQMTMFQNATSAVRNKLDIMCEQVRATMRGRVERMFREISRDYMTVVGSDTEKDHEMGKAEKLARKKVDEAILQSELPFGEVLRCDLTQLEDVGMGDDDEAGVEDGMDFGDATQPLESGDDFE